MRVHLDPRPQEDDVRGQQLVLERGSEHTVLALDRLLDLASDPAHRPNRSALELSHFQSAGEHAFDEAGVLEDLFGLADQLQLLDHPRCASVELGDDACRCDAEARRRRVEQLHRHKACRRRGHRAVDLGEAMHVLRRVLDHAVALLAGDDGLEREQRHRLEPPPAHREDQRVVVLEDLLVPSVLLDSDLDEAERLLHGSEPSD
mmetsp:Transcript_16919/g.40557  ORF Transcript_16919/g.40557 Transcript_16919/m.40557 type:complete len:204 (+) Transcript_16919:728-1339(+)